MKIETWNGRGHWHEKQGEVNLYERISIRYTVGMCKDYDDMAGPSVLLNISTGDGAKLETSLSPDAARSLGERLIKGARKYLRDSEGI